MQGYGDGGDGLEEFGIRGMRVVRLAVDWIEVSMISMAMMQDCRIIKIIELTPLILPRANGNLY